MLSYFCLLLLFLTIWYIQNNTQWFIINPKSVVLSYYVMRIINIMFIRFGSAQLMNIWELSN